MLLTQPVAERRLFLPVCGEFTPVMSVLFPKPASCLLPLRAAPTLFSTHQNEKVIFALKELLGPFSLDQILIFSKQMNSLQLSWI